MDRKIRPEDVSFRSITTLSDHARRLVRQFGGLVSVIFLLGFVVYHLGWGAKVGINVAPTEQNFGETKIRFREVTAEIGPDFPWTSFKESESEFINAGVIFRQPAALAVAEINRDSFMDVVLLNSTEPFVHVAFLDRAEKKFRGQPKLERRLRDAQTAFQRERPTAVHITDIDGDGKTDFIISYSVGCPLLFRDVANFGVSSPPEPFGGESCPMATTIAEADINFDGKTDFVFGQYSRGANTEAQANHKLNNKSMGGLSTLLIRKEGTDFDFYHFPQKTFVASIGFTYLEGMPSLAIFRGNDYSVDELNVLHDGKIRDITADRMPYAYHGYAGMNSEFFDFDKDGDLDLYVSNIYAPPFQRRGNVFWVRNSDGTFSERSDEFGVRRCGFAWAGKFASFDNSGNYQLLVVNGVWENDDAAPTSRGDGSRDYWNIRTLRRVLPSFLQTDALIRKTDLYFSGNNQWCLFDFSQKPAINIAPAAGVSLNSPTRSMALVDFDNSGRLSFVTADINGRLSIFKNESIELGNWIGLHLVPDHMALGAKVVFESLEPKIVREVFPSNGYGAQSDPRIHVGLGAQSADSVSVKVTLSTGKSKAFTLRGLGIYHQVDVSELAKP